MKKQRLLLSSWMIVFASVALAAGNYQLRKRIAVPGTGGWDYVTVDDAARRVYISHSTQVDVLDADSLTYVGTIPNTPGAHGVAIDPLSGGAT
jgi:hypothetical protein